MHNSKAAVLAVGTEITDGQITNRNSAWLSQKLLESGIHTTEHRAVPDERATILTALEEISSRHDVLFVTGGLGPTSDDFTREVVAEFLNEQLIFDDRSWAHVQQRLQARGVVIRESQKNQCFFPLGAKVLENPAGTANGFYCAHKNKHVFVLPGPPAEIAAIWENNLGALLNTLFPPAVHERLFIFRCMGKGESEFAHITEEIFSGSKIRLGYRAHNPYVEIKIWVRDSERAEAKARLAELEKRIAPYLINRDDEDLARDLLRWVVKNPLVIYDSASHGLLGVRLATEIQESKLPSAELNLTYTTDFQETIKDLGGWAKSLAPGTIGFAVLGDATQFHVAISMGGVLLKESFAPPFCLPTTSERARKYLVEKALFLFRSKVISAKNASR